MRMAHVHILILEAPDSSVYNSGPALTARPCRSEAAKGRLHGSARSSVQRRSAHQLLIRFPVFLIELLEFEAQLRDVCCDIGHLRFSELVQDHPQPSRDALRVDRNWLWCGGLACVASFAILPFGAASATRDVFATAAPIEHLPQASAAQSLRVAAAFGRAALAHGIPIA